MKILIIKLGALGDVLRTTPLLRALKIKYPAALFTWLVDSRHREVLEGNPFISELLFSSPQTILQLERASFDLAINLDKEEEALEAISRVNAKKKMGFGRSSSAELCALDSLSDYAFRLGIDDELKFKLNKKTYQEISFEQVGLSFRGEEYLFELKNKDFDAKKFSKPIIGLNTGSGVRFSGKKLSMKGTLDLIQKLKERLGATMFLLGGPEEIERNREIERLSPAPVVNTGSHPIGYFASIVKACDLIISGDTTAMHIAIAVKVPVVAYFASTCAAEIELYGRGKKIISNIHCSPCYKKDCPIDEQCMKDMDPELLFQAVQEVLR